MKENMSKDDRFTSSKHTLAYFGKKKLDELVRHWRTRCKLEVRPSTRFNESTIKSNIPDLTVG